MMNGDSCVSLLVSPTMLQSAAFGRTADRSRIIPIAIPDAVPFGGNRTGRKTLRQKVYSMNLYGLLRKECDELISAWSVEFESDCHRRRQSYGNGRRQVAGFLSIALRY